MGRSAVAGLLVFACSYLGAVADVGVRFPGAGAGILFPPYAIVTAALLRTPARSWWLILLAASIGDYLPHRFGGASVSFVLLSEFANHLRAVLAATGVRLFASRSGRFDSLRGIVVYLVFAVVLAPCVGALAGVAVVASHFGRSGLSLVWQEWALSNALTALTLLPLLMIDLRTIAGVRRVSGRRVVEASMLASALIAVAAAVFIGGSAGAAVHPAQLYWPLPFLLWAAVRFGPRGTSAALLAVTALSIWGAFEQRGPFATQSPADDLVELQLFLLAASVPLLLLAAGLEEQRRTATALAESRRLAESERLALQAQRLVESALREADRRKDEFLAMLGHELRNPLTPIGLALEIIREAPPQSSQANWAREAIGRQVHHLTRLVDDLLDTSRVTMGKIRLQLEAVELGSIVANAVETTRPIVDSLGHVLVVDLPEGPMPLHGDAVRLAQVIGNLLNNAAKYTERGGRIELSVRREGSDYRVSVRDDGIGIPAEALGRIFELFSQIPEKGRVQQGLGIGLTLVKALVEMHGGSVEAHSAGRGQGSELVVRVPAGNGELEGRDAVPSPVAVVRSAPLRMHAAAADDVVTTAVPAPRNG